MINDNDLIKAVELIGDESLRILDSEGITVISKSRLEMLGWYVREIRRLQGILESIREILVRDL